MSALKPVRDLRAAVERVSAEYFASILHPRAVWGRPVKYKKRPAGLQCANYNEVENLITVHPVFARQRVPQWVLDWLLFHEMLHMVHGCKHSLDLVAHEARHPRTRDAERWLSKNLFAMVWRNFRG